MSECMSDVWCGKNLYLDLHGLPERKQEVQEVSIGEGVVDGQGLHEE